MATKVVMEALSPTMEEGRLVEWKKSEGDAVSTGDVLAEVETDKAVMELVARADGVLLKQVVAAGATVPVSETVGWIGAEGEETGEAAPKEAKPTADRPKADTPKAGTPKADEPKADEPKAKKPAADTPDEPRPKAAEPTAEQRPAAGDRVKASPLARKMAAERGLDLGSVQGSGPGGRIIQRDIQSAEAAPAAAAAAGAPARAVRGADEPFRDEPLSQVRKTIARRLAQSIGPVPTFYLTTEVDMERVAEAREALNATGEGKVSFNDIVIKATAVALSRHPECNAWWQDDHIRFWNDVHISMAVAIPEGLITPVIRHADRKTLREIGAEARDLAGRARDRKLKPEEYTGGTFSVSNLGMFDIDEFTAIINPPEAGILAVGRISEQVVPAGEGLEVRKRMRLTMSCDHRIIDGATGAQFLRTLKGMLENPLSML